MMLIDSYGWIEYFTDGPLADRYAPYIEKADEGNTITPTIVLYEVYKRIKGGRGEGEALEAYAQLSRTRIIPLTESLAMRAADISLELRLGMADAIIVATAEAYDAVIVTSDKHLRELRNVEFIGLEGGED